MSGNFKKTFDDFFQFFPVVTGVYKGLQGLTGITRIFRGLQGVTLCYSGLRGLQGIRKDYRKLVLQLECPQILLLSLFCIKRLQGVTMGYRGLQGDTESYNG